MDPKIANAVGLLRHQIISPVLMDRGAAQLAHFRKLAARDFEVPGKGPRRFTATTMKGWLYRYLRDFTKRDHPISLKRDHRMRVFRSVSDGS